MNNICALNKNQTTCLPDKSIKTIASNFINNTNKSTDTIINELSKKSENCQNLDNTQHKELCILKNIQKDNNTNKNINKLVNKHIIQYFKPVANKLDGNYWINNTEIDNIQHQLLKNFKGYYYSYIHMLDLKMFSPQTSSLIEEHSKILPITQIDFVDELKNTWPIDDENVSILDMGTGAFEVLFKLKGHNKIILVDAVINTNEPIGTIYKVPASEITAAPKDHPMIFLHSIKWDQALSYAKKILQDEYPDDITVYLIAIDNTKLEMQINDVVKNSGDKVINLIKQDLMQLHND